MSIEAIRRWLGSPLRLGAWIALAALVAVGGYLVLRKQASAPPPPSATAPGRPAAPPVVPAIRAVVLVFANAEADGSVTEQRQLASHDRLEDDLLAVLQALCDGPTSRDAVSAIPPGTRPLAAFYDERQGSVVVDFSQELAANHPGGSAGEQATIAGIMRTIALNFPEIRSCSILIGGAQVETLAGHIALDRPLEPRRWL